MCKISLLTKVTYYKCGITLYSESQGLGAEIWEFIFRILPTMEAFSDTPNQGAFLFSCSSAIIYPSSVAC